MTKKLLPVASTFETKLLKQFQRLDRYLLIGEISLESGYSLQSVEDQLEKLEHKGAIRRLSYHERKKLGLHDLTEAFVLLNASMFSLVDIPL